MISVIIPVYNAADTVEKALLSVKNQRCEEEMEIIVVNDGSTDQSAEVVQDFMKDDPELQISLINQTNKGVSEARNVGMRAAKGEFIALLDADDEWLPEKTSSQMQYLLDPSLELDFIGCERNNEKIRFPYSEEKNGLAYVSFFKLLIRNGIPNTAIFKKNILKKSGYFDEKMRHAEDLDFYLRVAKHSKMAVLNRSLVITGNGKKSFGESGLSADLVEMEKGFQYTLKKLYDLEYLNFVEYHLTKFYFSIKYYLRIIRK